MYEVEKGIPIPTDSSRQHDRRREGRYGFSRLEPGQSIFCPGEKIGGRAYEAARKFGTRNKREMDWAEMEGGLRIWRVV